MENEEDDDRGFKTEEEHCRRFAMGVARLLFDASVEDDMYAMVVLDRALHLLVRKRYHLIAEREKTDPCSLEPVAIKEEDVFPECNNAKIKLIVARQLQRLVDLRFLRRAAAAAADRRWTTNFCELVDVMEGVERRASQLGDKAPDATKEVRSLRVTGGFEEREYRCTSCWYDDLGRTSESLAVVRSSNTRRNTCPKCGKDTLERTRSDRADGDVQMHPLRELLARLRSRVRTPAKFASADHVEDVQMQVHLN